MPGTEGREHHETGISEHVDTAHRLCSAFPGLWLSMCEVLGLRLDQDAVVYCQSTFNACLSSLMVSWIAPPGF